MMKFKFKNFIIWFLLGLYIFLGSSNLSAFAACFENVKDTQKNSFSQNSNIECCCCKKTPVGTEQVFNNKAGCGCMQSHIPANNAEKTNIAFSNKIGPEKIVNLYNFTANYLSFPEKNISLKTVKYLFSPNINTDIRSTIVLLI